MLTTGSDPLPEAEADLLNAVAGLQLRLGLTAEARATLGRLLAVEDDDDVRWRALDGGRVRPPSWARASGSPPR